MKRCYILTSTREFSLLQIIRTDSEAHKTSQSDYILGSLPGVKKSGGDAKHTPPAGADFRNEYSDTSTPFMPSHYDQE